MTRPTFSAALIAELRNRVIAHNESSPEKVTLNQLKKLYERSYKGERPADRALRKVDEHLGGLAKAFDPSKHPRRRDGQFGPEDKTAADHVKAAASAAADAAGSAASSAKRAAHHAAYYAGIADEPLKEGVKAPRKVPLGLPGNRDKHRALQAENAGYNALTSDVIPEQRGEIVGALVRTGAAATGGVLFAHMLTSKNPNNAVRRTLVRSAAYPAGLAAKIAVGIPLHSVAAGLRLAEDTLGIKLKSGRVKDFAHDMADGANLHTKAATAKAVDGAIRPMRWGAARFLDVMEGRSRVPPKMSDAIKPGERLNARNAYPAAKVAMKILRQEGRARGGRLGAAAFLAAVPAYLIDQAVTGTAMDPVTYGRTYDQASYRVVQKALAMPELQELQKAMTGELRKSVSGQAAEDVFSGVGNALKGKLFSRGGAALSTGLYSAVGSGAGALTGAATGASVQAVRNALGQGNPYHDSKGRFTSKEDADNSVADAAKTGALVGAGIGGLGLGIAAHVHLGRLNRGLFNGVMDRLDRHVAERTSAIQAPGKTSTIENIKDAYQRMDKALDGLEGRRSTFVAEQVAKNPEVQKLQEDISEHGAGSKLYYQRAATDEINSKLASLAAKHDAFLVRGKTGKALQPISDVRRDVANMHDHLRAAIGGMSEADFTKSIAGLRPSEQETLLGHFQKRGKVGEMVEAALADHHKGVAVAMKALEGGRADAKVKQEALDEAQGRAADTETALDRDLKGPELEAAQKAHEKNLKAVAGAEKALVTSQKKVNTLQATVEGMKEDGPSIKSGFDDLTIRPPSNYDLTRAVKAAQNDAEPAAQLAFTKEYDKTKGGFEKEIASMRDAHLAESRLSHARELAVAATLARGGAGLSGIAGKHADALFKADADHTAAIAKDEAAEIKLGQLNGTLANEKKKLAADRKKPATTPEAALARKSLEESVKKASADVEAAKNDLSVTGAARSTAQRKFAQEADAFQAKYNEYRANLATKKASSFIPPAALQAMADDVSRAAKAGYDPVLKYAIQPTGAALKDAMAFIKPHVRATTATATRQIGYGLRSLVTSPQIDPETNTTVHALNPWKITALASTGAIGTVAEALHAYSQYARARLGGDKNAKAPTLIKVEARRHATNEHEGMFVVHAQNPGNKKDPNDRIVLFGQIHKEGQDTPTNINAGAKLSDVNNLFSNSQNNQKGGKGGGVTQANWLQDKTKNDINSFMSKLPGDKKITINGEGVSIPARHSGEKEGNNLAGSFNNEFRAKFIKPETQKDAGAFYTALGNLFSEQSHILRPANFYHLLTGYRPNDATKGVGVIEGDEAFGLGTKEEAEAALDNAVTKITEKMPPRSDDQKDSLRRMVAVIGRVKELSADQLKPIYAKIDTTARPVTSYSPTAKNPEIPVSHVSSPAPDAPVSAFDDRALSAREEDQAMAISDSLGDKIGLTEPHQKQVLAETIGAFAAQITDASDIDTDQAVRLAGIAMMRLGGESGQDKGYLKSLLRRGDDTSFMEIQGTVQKVVDAYKKGKLRQHEQEFMEKAYAISGADLDDFDVLMKRMPAIPGAAPADSSGAPKHSALSNDFKLSADAARNFEPKETRGAFRAVQRAASSSVDKPPPAATYHPLKDTGAAAADLVAGGTANHLLDHVLPGVKGFGWTKTPEVKLASVASGLGRRSKARLQPPKAQRLPSAAR